MKKSFLVLTLQIIFTFSLFSQSNSSNVKNNAITTYEIQSNIAEFFNENKTQFRLSEGTTFKEIKQVNLNHKKYKQFYKDLEVYGSSLNLHLKNGKIISSNGNFLKDITLDITPQLERRKIEKTALLFFYGNKDKSKLKASLNDHKSLDVSSSLVVINTDFPTNNGDNVLAYKLILEDKTQHKKIEYVIDAKNGQLIFTQNLICTHNVIGKGKTYYYGEKTFSVDSISPNQFFLDDKVRNIRTSVLNNSNKETTLMDNDNIWEFAADDKNSSAIDAHYCTSKFHDMMHEKFNYLGVDGNNGAMNSILLDEANFVNAYWDGKSASFGKGDCHYSPLTTYTVVGHEFTHGVTQYNSNLIYDSESGAINESLSDIFGKALEYFEDRGNFSWDIDAKIMQDEFAKLFRSMSDPKKVSNPALYKGEFWLDDNDVHINSSILNYWFYLMVEGKTDVNEKGTNYEVKANDIIDVLKIVFLCQTSYLESGSDYNQLYEFSKAACEELYGKNSQIYNSLEEAWKAVGLPDSGSNQKPKIDLALLNNFAGEETCNSIGDFIDISISLKNNGSNTIKKNTTLNFDIDGNTFMKKLAKDLLSGENLTLDFVDAYEITEFGFNVINIELVNSDEKESNNQAFVILNILSKINDLNFIVTKLDIEDCSETKVKFIGFIINESCETNLMNEVITIEFFSGSTKLASIDTFINGELSSYESFIIEKEFYSSLFLDKEEVTIKLVSDFDPEEVLNLKYLNIIFEKINKPIFYNFEEGQIAFKDFKIDLNNYTSTYDYNDENYFKVEADFNTIPCKNITDMSPIGKIESCLDLSTFILPRITFDMVQFRSDVFQNTALNENSNILQIIITDNDGNSLIKNYNNFTQGNKEKYSFDLPSKFSGSLSLKFFLANNSFFGGEFTETDAILIDNFSIMDVVATTQTSNETVIILSPNPTNSNTTIHSNEPFQYTVQDIYGRILRSAKSMNNFQDIETTSFSDGLYYIHVTCNSGISKTMPLIKIK